MDGKRVLPYPCQWGLQILAQRLFLKGDVDFCPGLEGYPGPSWGYSSLPFYEGVHSFETRSQWPSGCGTLIYLNLT